MTVKNSKNIVVMKLDLFALFSMFFRTYVDVFYGLRPLSRTQDYAVEVLSCCIGGHMHEET